MDRKQHFFVWLTAIFVAALVTGDFIGGRFFVLFGHTFSAGIIPFPLTFVLTDIVNEFYGTERRAPPDVRRPGRRGLRVGRHPAGAAPAAQPDVADPRRRSSRPRSAPRRASTSRRCRAYVIGQLLDISIFRTLRRATGHRLLWLRATGSTVLSQMIDSFTVSFVFLAGTQSLGFITSNAANNYVGKLIMAVLLTPVIYAMHAVFRRRFHLAGTGDAAGVSRADRALRPPRAAAARRAAAAPAPT